MSCSAAWAPWHSDCPQVLAFPRPPVSNIGARWQSLCGAIPRLVGFVPVIQILVAFVLEMASFFHQPNQALSFITT